MVGTHLPPSTHPLTVALSPKPAASRQIPAVQTRTTFGDMERGLLQIAREIDAQCAALEPVPHIEDERFGFNATHARYMAAKGVR